MNILHVVLSGGWGGSEAIAFELCNALSRIERVGVAVKTSDQFSIEFYRGRLKPEIELIDASDNADDLISLCSFKPDIVHAHLGPSVARIKNVNGPKKIGHMHMRFYSTQFLEMDAVIAVAPWQLADIPRIYRGSSYLVPNFMPHGSQGKASEKASLRRELGLKDSDRLIGTTGRLNHDKGFDVLIEAMHLLDGSLHCVIVGHGALEERLKAQAIGMKNIHFVGFKTDVLGLLRDLDLYVSASRADSFGLSLLEAMHVGLPVIATKTYGSMHLLEGSPARLVEIEDHVQLAEAINRFISAPPDIDGYNLERFSVQRSASLLEKAYEEILCGRPNTRT